MLITVRVPDSTTKLLYIEQTDVYEPDPKPITLGQYIKVEKDESDETVQTKAVNYSEGE